MPLSIGHFYKNRKDELIQIVAEIKDGELGYNQGYRFRDNQQSTYLPNGRWSAKDKQKTDKDLIIQADSGVGV